MNNIYNIFMLKHLRKVFSCLVILIFLTIQTCPLLPAKAYAQNTPISPISVLNLPAPGVMVTQSLDFLPVILRGIKLYPDNPLRFDFIVDTGDTELADAELKKETSKLIRYFLTSLTVPEDDLWVNLSPYEKNRIIPDKFGITEMGRDLLSQDYILKQLTASLIYPEDALGEHFWDKIYAQASKLYGTIDIPLKTFNKVWIIPEKAVIYENGDTAFIVESHLKVLLEKDYLSILNDSDNNQSGVNTSQKEDSERLRDVSSSIIKEIILPEIEKEVNEGENFIQLRQIYNSLILAAWFKRNLKNGLLGKIYVGQNKVTGVDIEDTKIKEKIYQQYMRAFKTGAYNYIREEYDPNTRKIIPKKYFAGGTAFNKKQMDAAMLTGSGKGLRARAEEFLTEKLRKARVLLKNLIPPEKTAREFPPVVNEGWLPINPENSETVKKSPTAFEYSDPDQDFRGVDLEHFVVAQNKLAERSLPDEVLKSVLSFLNIRQDIKGETAYAEIYETLTETGYSKKVVDIINGETYKDPRLRITIIGQNENPRGQGINEAGSNGLDALGLNIGQFSKGVKQNIDWLEATGVDRIDVFTKEKGEPPYRNSLLKDTNDQEYTQIEKIENKVFDKATGKKGGGQAL